MPRENMSKVIVAFPPTMLEEIHQIAVEERRSRADLIREAVRQYAYAYKIKQKELVTAPR